MSEFTPKVTPWGWPEMVTECKSGIFFVSTPTHGGFWLDPERRKELPDSLKNTSFVDAGCGEFGFRNDSTNRWQLNAWWEEDCDGPKIADYFGIQPIA